MNSVRRAVLVVFAIAINAQAQMTPEGELVDFIAAEQ